MSCSQKRKREVQYGNDGARPKRNHILPYMCFQLRAILSSSPCTRVEILLLPSRNLESMLDGAEEARALEISSEELRMEFD